MDQWNTCCSEVAWVRGVLAWGPGWGPGTWGWSTKRAGVIADGLLKGSRQRAVELW